jgi:CRISPR-associated protein Cas2
MVIVVYDIPDDKRRTRLANFLLGYGNRIQLSVFECFITIEEMRQLYQLVKNKVKPEEDNVRFYWISNESTSLTLTIGSEKPSPPPNYYVI